MEQELLRRGHQVVAFEEAADAYVVNSCSVTAVSDRKSRQMLYRVRREHPEAVLALDGEGSSMGEFLTGLLENRLPGQQKEGVTLRQVYHLWYQEGALMHLPVIKAENDSIQVFFPGENKDG